MFKEKISYKPFRYSFKDGDIEVFFTFTCQKCNGHNAIKLSKPWGNNSFWSGYFMCSDCGTSLCDGDSICYYSSCFKRHETYMPIQLDLFPLIK